MIATPGPVERIMARDTWVVIAAVSLIVFLAGLYTVMGVGMSMSALDMTRMAGPVGEPMPMGPPKEWTWGYALLIFLMWWVMMIAMMTPSAAPVLLLFTALKRRGTQKNQATSLSITFLLGYLLAWMGFSAFAMFLQWLTESVALTNGPMMTLGSKPVAGVVLLAAGLYQFSSLKAACLRHCRSPAHFLSAHNRKGHLGALQMGMHHGVYCLGCCWALMALLFVGGIMNLYWIVGLAIYVLVEKLIPHPRLFSQATGIVLIAAGVWILVSAF
jgi:predicted metal-binding membrane protein